MRLKTNYNNKLSCTGFIHIAPAPIGFVSESKINQVIFIGTEDNSHPGKSFRLIDFFRIPLNKLRSVFTVPSHGVESDQFIFDYIEANPTARLDSEMAVYFYISEEPLENSITGGRSP